MKQLICLALMLGGCTTVRLSDHGENRIYLGVVRVTVPDQSGNITAFSVQTAGAGWNHGPWLGWRSDEWVEADPSQCQLLVVIRTSVEAKNAADVLRVLKGQNACVADYTNTLRR